MRIDSLKFSRKALRSSVLAATVLAASVLAATSSALLLSTAAGQAQQVAAVGPFEELGGSWSGTGIVNLREGGKERVRCKASYVVKNAGFGIDQELTCASDAYKFEMTSNIVQQGDTLTGIWFESVHRVAGRVVGKSNGSQIDVRAEGDTFTALLNVTTHGDKQSMLMQSPGSRVESVSISLTRNAK
jgi:plastocyanin